MGAMSFALAGAGAVLAASATAFTLLKWAGALYLIGLGTVTIARSRQGLEGRRTSSPSRPARPSSAT